jgi:RecB family exonuclease
VPDYSYSRLNTFKDCPLKFKLQYLDRARTGVENIDSFLGNRVHETLDQLYRDLRDGRMNHLDDLLDFYRFKWEEKWHSGVRIVRRNVGADEYFSYGVESISGYYRRNYPFDQSRTISLEEKVEFSLDWAGHRRFLGRVDRVASRPDGTYEIHDYKTTRRSPDQQDDRQLMLYQVAVQSAHPEARPIELVWHYLSHGVTNRLRCTQSDLLNVLQAANKAVDRIEQTQWFPPTKDRVLCDWCEFRGICPAWK